MHFIFSTGSLWSYSLERCFLLAKEAGFAGIELMVDQRWDTRQIGFLQRLIAQFDLPIMAVHSPFWPQIDGWPNDQPGRIKQSIHLAEEVGANTLIHHLPARINVIFVSAGGRFFALPAPWLQSETSYRNWLETDYPDIQANTSVKLCIENMPAWNRLGRSWQLHHWNTPEQMKLFNHITMDTTHLGTWGLEPSEIYHQWGNRVGHVHLSNYDGREHRRPHDGGSLKLDQLIAQMAHNGYDRAISLEVYPDVLDAGQPDQQVISQMRACLQFCQNAITPS